MDMDRLAAIVGSEEYLRKRDLVRRMQEVSGIRIMLAWGVAAQGFILACGRVFWCIIFLSVIGSFPA